MSGLGTPKFLGVANGLAALALGLFLGSCSYLDFGSKEALPEGFARLRDTAHSVITDADRRDRFLAHCQALESEFVDFEQYATEFAARYREAFTDYDAGQDDLRRLSAAFRERQQASQERFVELHLAMAGAVTGREWEALGKQEARIVESLLHVATSGSG